MNHADSIALLSRASTVVVAGTDAGGAPMLRTVHGVVLDGFLAFHGGPKGTKHELLGRPVVIQADEVVATLPSRFFHAERACPATTWFRSAQARGVLQATDDAVFKAAVLQALMEKLQPEGGHRPITATDPMYDRVVQGLVVARIPLTDVVGRDKRGQGKPAAVLHAVLAGLWDRGGPGDLAAIESIREASPDLAAPGFLAAPAGCSVHVALRPGDAEQMGRALRGMYWNVGLSVERLARAVAGSSAVVVVRDVETGAIVGGARASSDDAKTAWIYDVWVDEDRRGLGLGRVLMRVLMAHPAVRSARRVHLSTKDAAFLYERFGFRPSEEVHVAPYRRIAMSLDRGPDAEAGADWQPTANGLHSARPTEDSPCPARSRCPAHSPSPISSSR